MALMPDLAEWPLKSEVMEKLDLSLSQVNNLIKAKRLEVKMRKRPGLPPIGVINPADLAREIEQRSAAEPHVMPEGEARKGETIAVRRPEVYNPSNLSAGMAQVLERCLEHVVSLGQRSADPPAEKLYLTLTEAAEFSGLPKGFLQQIAADIGFRIGRSWRIPRESLKDGYRIGELARMYGPKTNGELIDDAEENPRWEPLMERG